ncbi:MAG TPA: hypothetical protein VFB76_15975 [Candidatus Angelobacter sp.]|nr:hypothetical protein [Candidatus Angelobacter sp.]
MTRLRCPVCGKENSATLGHKHKVSFKCDGCGTEVLVERHTTEDAHHRYPKKEQYRLHPKRA